MKKIFFFLLLMVLTKFVNAQTIADTSDLRTAINTDIVPNAVGGITATKLNRILIGNIDALSKVGITSITIRNDSTFSVKDETETFLYKLHTSIGNSASLAFGTISAQTAVELTITVTGAFVGDPVVLSIPPTCFPGSTEAVIFNAYVSAINTVTVRCTNASAGSLGITTASFKVTVLK